MKGNKASYMQGRADMISAIQEALLWQLSPSLVDFPGLESLHEEGTRPCLGA